MRWVDLKSILLRPVIERRLTLGLLTRYRRRSLLEIVRKREEFQKKLNEASKHHDYKSQELVAKYRYYLDCLTWVLHADQ
jgi:hypothetical protein